MRRHGTLIVLAALAAALMLPAAAFAVALPGEIIIRASGFESAYGPEWTVAPAAVGPPASTAYWGRITQRLHSGSYGLWCAGGVPGSPASNGWLTFGGQYPENTAGLAILALPELAGYYSSRLSYWYTLPSRGAEDGISFQVMWGERTTGPWDSHPDRPLATTWRSESWDLSAPANIVSLSRAAGVVRFGFVDLAEGFGETPLTGEGPTIDDVLVSGYTYGPPQGLAASVVGGKAHVTWTVPWRTSAGGGLEVRPVAYRLWRAPDVQPYVWTELTVTRQSATTFDDPASLTGTYRYAVQAWDTGTGTGHGFESSAAVTLSSGGAETTPTAVIASVGPATLPSNSTLTMVAGGQATDPAGHAITSYEWTSSRDDWLGTTTAPTLTLMKSGLSVGQHTVTLRVTCSHGVTSAAATWPTAITVTTATDYRPVYRFYNLKKGVHFYTANVAEMLNVLNNFSSIYRFEGVAYSVNAANPANNAPLYRFYNLKQGVHFYTANEAEMLNVLNSFSSIYRFEGVAYYVSNTPGPQPVYRFFNLRQGVHFYTANEAEMLNVLNNFKSIYRFEGAGYYLAP